MSLLGVDLPSLTLRPRIEYATSSMTVETGGLLQLLSAYSYRHRVEFLFDRGRVRFQTRMFYVFTHEEELNVSDLWYLDYECHTHAVSWGRTLSSFTTTDQLESFAIALVTRDDVPHRVCAFRGEGSVATGWEGVLLGGDSVIDIAGTQEDESRAFALALARRLGIPLGKPIQDLARMATCAGCGHLTSLHKPKCLYCGKPWQAVAAPGHPG